jgi:hypothetical protein
MAGKEEVVIVRRPRRRQRQSMQRLITKGIARVVAARFINDIVNRLFDMWDNRKANRG